MQKRFFVVLLFLIGLISVGQNLKAVTIIPQRSYCLNGGFRSFAGGKSRETIKIDLPQGTKSWYYSFTTKPGVDGTALLNLGLQLTASLYGNVVLSSLASKISVPKGSGSADVLLLAPKYRDMFLGKEENWRYFKDVSLENATQAVQYVGSDYGSSFYLGLRNPSAATGINITIEVVAIVEEGNVDSEKGILYGNLGWKAFENGEFDQCIALSDKALTFDPNLIYVRFNIALVHLIQQKDDSIDYYVNAISACKNDKNPKGTLEGALQDLQNLEVRQYGLKNLNSIKDMISMEIDKY